MFSLSDASDYYNHAVTGCNAHVYIYCPDPRVYETKWLMVYDGRTTKHNNNELVTTGGLYVIRETS